MWQIPAGITKHSNIRFEEHGGEVSVCDNSSSTAAAAAAAAAPQAFAQLQQHERRGHKKYGRQHAA